MHMRSLSFFSITTMLLIHGVGSVTLATTPFCSNSWMALIIFYLMRIGIRLGNCCTGWTVGSISRCSSPGRHPNPSNTSSYMEMISSVVLGVPGTSFVLILHGCCLFEVDWVSDKFQLKAVVYVMSPLLEIWGCICALHGLFWVPSYGLSVALLGIKAGLPSCSKCWRSRKRTRLLT